MVSLAVLLLVACRDSEPAPFDGDGSSTVDSSPTHTGQSTTGPTSSTGTSDTAPETFPWGDDERYILVRDAPMVSGTYEESDFGATLASGMDLDHDGIAEWAASAPRASDYEGDYLVVVRTYEGTVPVAERRPTDTQFDQQYGEALGAADVDGDGFRDLLWSSAFGEGRLWVARQVEPLDDTVMALDPGPDSFWSMDPRAVSALPVESGPEPVLVTWSNAGESILTYGALPSSGGTVHEPVRLVAADQEVLRVRTDTAPFEGEAAALDDAMLLAGTPAELWVGFVHVDLKANDGLFGYGLRCPLPDGGLSNCIATEPDDLEHGRAQSAGDLDGDGLVETVTSAPRTRDYDGALSVYNADGSWRATVRGTQLAQFGREHLVVVDDHGEAWLLVAQSNFNGYALTAVYAYRGSSLVGELTDMDADRFYVDGTMGQRLGTAMAAYRPTPDAPLQLLLTHPGEGYGAVYIVPFEPK